MKKYLTLRYLLALALVALLATISFLASRQIASSTAYGAALINLSGQQRMLSQRIALQSIRMATDIHAEHRRQAKRALMKTVDRMEAAHLVLTGKTEQPGLPVQNSKALHDLYFKGNDPLDARVLRYLALAREVPILPGEKPDLHDKRLQELLDESMAGLLDQLDQAVRLYQKESEDQVALLKTIQSVSFGLMLLLLAGVALFIFRPMAEHIESGQRRLEELNSQLAELAATDSLTGCWNRRKFEGIIEREMNTARRYHSPLSLLVMDIDHFKTINDSLGHLAGDQVLAGLGELVQGHIRASDYLVRWGGEEFVLLLPETNLTAARKVAEKLRREVEHARFAGDVGATVSLGVAQYTPGEDTKSLVQRADRALYDAKNNGRNNVVTAKGMHPENENHDKE